jgi:molecular chaperone DnaJ
MNKDLNYYEILSVDFKIDKKVLKNNYRTLSKKYHPDKNEGDDSQFKLINEAYKILSNDELKSKYDKESKYGQNYDPMNDLLDFEFSNSNVSGTKVDEKLKYYKNKELIHIVLEFSEYKSPITYTRNIICSNCDGTGNTSILNEGGKLGELFKDDEMKCDICEGTGVYNGRECPACKGEGYITLGLSKCNKCEGSGLKEVSKTIEVKKEDFKEGKLMVKYHGNQSKYNGIVGNLYLILKKF